MAVGATRIEGFPTVAASPAFRRAVSATIFFEKIKRTSSNFLQRSDAEVVHWAPKVVALHDSVLKCICAFPTLLMLRRPPSRFAAPNPQQIIGKGRHALNNACATRSPPNGCGGVASAICFLIQGILTCVRFESTLARVSNFRPRSAVARSCK